MKDPSFEGVLARIEKIIGSNSPKNLSAILGISAQAVYKGLRGERIPETWVYKLAAQYGVSPQWILSGEGPMRLGENPVKVEEGSILPAPHLLQSPEQSWAAPVFVATPPTENPWKSTNWQEVPVIALGNCGKTDWYSPDPVALRATLPVDYPYTPNLFAVMAVGTSMQPEGIRQGYILFCNPSSSIDPGDVVYVEKKDGSAAIKKYLKQDDQLLHLQGWSEPQKNGTQAPYYEELELSLIKRVVCVVVVKRKA